jgi:hypothetical protein
MTSRFGPIPTGQAARILGVTRAQLDKLIGCGLLPVTETTPGGQRRVDSGAVLDLADWPYAPTADPAERPCLAVHLGPLKPDSNGTANQRTHLGYHVDPAAAGLTQQQVEDAWAGLWNCTPEPYVGSYLIGDVSGFVVAVAAITGYRIVNRTVRFDVSPARPEIQARYAKHRIPARQGAPFQVI